MVPLEIWPTGGIARLYRATLRMEISKGPVVQCFTDVELAKPMEPNLMGASRMTLHVPTQHTPRFLGLP